MPSAFEIPPEDPDSRASQIFSAHLQGQSIYIHETFQEYLNGVWCDGLE